MELVTTLEGLHDNMMLLQRLVCTVVKLECKASLHNGDLCMFHYNSFGHLHIRSREVCSNGCPCRSGAPAEAHLY